MIDTEFQIQSLQDWANEHYPDISLRHKDGYWNQIAFVRDTLHWLFTSTYEETKINPVLVIGSHYSKSVELPVFQIVTPRLTVTLRYNFYNWNVSVQANGPLPYGWHKGMINGVMDGYLFFEGFPSHLKFPTYNDQMAYGMNTKFSCAVNDNYQLYTFMFLLTNTLGVVQRNPEDK